MLHHVFVYFPSAGTNNFSVTPVIYFYKAATTKAATTKATTRLLPVALIFLIFLARYYNSSIRTCGHLTQYKTGTTLQV